MMKKLYLYLFIICSHALFSQSMIVSDGGEIKNNGGTITYTVGQFVTSLSGNENQSVTVGIQQPFENDIFLSLDDPELSITTTVYPNPATNYLILHTTDKDNSNNLTYTICSINGLMLDNNKIKATETTIDLKQYSSSIYILQLFKDGQPIKSFKIIKN